MGDEAAVAFLVGVVEAAFDDAFAERVEVGDEELLELGGEEVAPLACAFVVDFDAALELFLDL